MKCFYCNKNTESDNTVYVELAIPIKDGLFGTTYDKEVEMVYVDRCKTCKVLHKMRNYTLYFFIIVFGIGHYFINDGWLIMGFFYGSIAGVLVSWLFFKPIQWIRKMKPMDKVESHPEVVALFHKGFKIKNVEDNID